MGDRPSTAAIVVVKCSLFDHVITSLCHGVAKTKVIGLVTIVSPSLHVDKQMESVLRFVSGHL